MPLYGFAINFKNGSTDYVLSSACNMGYAETQVILAVEDCDGGEMESIVPYDAATIIEEQYANVAVLSTQFSGGSDA